MRADYQDQVTEAKTIEQPVTRRAREAGWIAIKVGVQGWPDKLFVKNGRHVWIEFKTPWGAKAKLQETRIKMLTDAGAEAYFVDSVARGCEILGC